MFDEPIMANRLIRSCLKSTSNREYLQFAFGKILRKCMNIDSYIAELKQESPTNKSKSKMVPLEKTKSVDTSMSHTSSSCSQEPCLKLYSAALSPKKEEKVEELKLVHRKSMDDDMLEESMLICNKLLKQLRKTLIFMPASTRYLCKLIADQIAKYVLAFLVIIIEQNSGNAIEYKKGYNELVVPEMVAQCLVKAS